MKEIQHVNIHLGEKFKKTNFYVNECKFGFDKILAFQYAIFRFYWAHPTDGGSIVYPYF